MLLQSVAWHGSSLSTGQPVCLYDPWHQPLLDQHRVDHLTGAERGDRSPVLDVVWVSILLWYKREDGLLLLRTQMFMMAVKMGASDCLHFLTKS